MCTIHLLQLGKMESAIEKLKERIDIVELIGSYVSLKKAGRNFKGLCPFHQEKTPSFIVSPDRQLWRCFGSCGTGGDSIAFVIKYENLSFAEAVTELAEKYGVQLEAFKAPDASTDLRGRLLAIHRTAAEYYHYVLTKTSFGNKALEYLSSRGITEKIIKTFQLGYSPSSWDSFHQYAQKKHFAVHDLIEGGLCIRKQNGGVYDRFRGRIMFPLMDHRGNVVGFSGRILAGESEAKYVNTPETPIYHKRSMLYGLHLVKDSIKKHNSVIIVEGEFDMIAPYQHGIDTIVAIKGSALTIEQLQLIKRYTNRVNIALDADSAGEEAVRRAIEVAEPLGFELGVITIPEGKDPDEAVRTNERHFKDAIKKPVPVYDFLIDLFVKKHPPSDPFSKKMIGDEMAPFLYNISNPIVQSFYIKQIARILDVSEESIHKVVYSYKKRRFVQRRSPEQPKKTTMPRSEKIQHYFIGQLLQSDSPNNHIQSFSVNLNQNDFLIPALGSLYEALEEYVKKHDVYSMNLFASSLSPELRVVADDIYMQSSIQTEKSDTSLDVLAVEIKADSLKKQIQKLLEDTSGSHDDSIARLQAELKEVEKKHSTL